MSGLFLLIGSSGVFAQDANDWTGFYAGVGLSASQAQLDPHVSSIDWSTSAWGGGSGIRMLSGVLPVQADSLSLSLVTGYGLQLGSAFVGIEGDLDLAPAVSTKEFFVELGQGCPDFFCLASDGSAGFDTLGRVRALVGVVIDPAVMGFFAGGVAIGQASAELSTRVIVPGLTDEDAATASDLVAGITLGAGVEIKATDHLRIRAEALVDSYAPWSYDLQSLSSATASGKSGSVDYVLGGDAVFSSTSGRLSAIWQF